MTLDRPHLSIDEMLAATDRPGDVSSQAHLAICASCRAEADDWAAVATAVRSATASPSNGDLSGLLAALETVEESAPGRAQSRGSKRVWMGSAAAAAVAVAAGITYAVNQGTGSSPAQVATSAGAQPTAGLVAVVGCQNLEGTVGTLRSVNGSTLVLDTKAGQPVTVTASGSTELLLQVSGSVADINDGDHVIVRGTYADGTLTAGTIAMIPRGAPGISSRLGGSLDQMMLQRGNANGTVSGTASNGFTIVEADGTKVPVTTSASTTVAEVVRSTLEQSSGELKIGTLTSAVGTAGPNGTLVAKTVEQQQFVPGQSAPTLPQGLPNRPSSANGIHSLPSLPGRFSGASGQNCSPDAIADSFLSPATS